MKILSMEEINREFIADRADSSLYSQPIPQAPRIPPSSAISSHRIKQTSDEGEKPDADRYLRELQQLPETEKDKSSTEQDAISDPGYRYPPYTKNRRRASRVSIVILSICAVLCVLIAIGVWTGCFGYSLFRVTSGSMQREIPEGSLVITKPTDPRRIIIGDTITYRKEEGCTVTHKVVDIIEKDGARQFKTQGTENPVADPKPVESENVVGLVVYHAAGLGTLLSISRGISMPLSLVLILLTLWLSFRGSRVKSERIRRTQAYKTYAIA